MIAMMTRIKKILSILKNSPLYLVHPCNILLNHIFKSLILRNNAYAVALLSDTKFLNKRSFTSIFYEVCLWLTLFKKY